jgi:hypothetical protein
MSLSLYNNKGIVISILLLIIMMLICHIMNYLYPKNKFENIPLSTDYNQLYYDNQFKPFPCKALQEQQAQVPCKAPVPTCPPVPTTTKYELSESELAVLYKYAYEESAREIFMRTINEIKRKNEE